MTAVLSTLLVLIHLTLQRPIKYVRFLNINYILKKQFKQKKENEGTVNRYTLVITEESYLFNYKYHFSFLKIKPCGFD